MLDLNGEVGSEEYITGVIDYVLGNDNENNLRLASIRARRDTMFICVCLFLILFGFCAPIGYAMFHSGVFGFVSFIGGSAIFVALMGIFMYPKMLRWCYRRLEREDREEANNEELDDLREQADKYLVFKHVLRELFKLYKGRITRLMYSRLMDYADTLEKDHYFEQFVASINSEDTAILQE